jgi:hypothetical protein
MPWRPFGQTEIVGTVPFESGEAEVHRGATVPLSMIRHNAIEKLKILLPRSDHNSIRERDRFRSAYAPFDVIDNSLGQRLVLFTVIRPDWMADDYLVTVQSDGTVLRVETWSRTTCIAKGTLIATPSGAKPVEDLHVGDSVLSFDLHQRATVSTIVRGVLSSVAEETILLGGKLRATAMHPVFASGQWKPAGKIDLADWLLDDCGRTVPAGRVQREEGLTTVFDVEVDEPHNFFAGGVLVHNKSMGYGLGYFDPWNAFRFKPPEQSRLLWPIISLP